MLVARIAPGRSESHAKEDSLAAHSETGIKKQHMISGPQNTIVLVIDALSTAHMVEFVHIA